jgi:hypothetical protein
MTQANEILKVRKEILERNRELKKLNSSIKELKINIKKGRQDFINLEDKPIPKVNKKKSNNIKNKKEIKN